MKNFELIQELEKYDPEMVVKLSIFMGSGSYDREINMCVDSTEFSQDAPPYLCLCDKVE